MYYYILDPTGLPPEKFERSQVELQGLLTEFNISGETPRVTPLRSIADLVDTASQRGVKTLVACGSDETFNVMLASLRGRDFILAFVPFAEQSYLSQVFGLGSIAQSVRTIAARRIETVDLANVGSNYFLSSLELGFSPTELRKAGWMGTLKQFGAAATQMTFRIDDSYDLETNAFAALIVNTRASSSSQAHIANPTDGYLDLLLLEKLKVSTFTRYKSSMEEGFYEDLPNHSVIRCRRVELLEPKGFPIKVSGKVITKFPALVEITPKRLRVIVGKNRTF